MTGKATSIPIASEPIRRTPSGGPTMRALYGRLRRTEPPHFHKLIIAALRAGDEPGLRLAVRTDVTQGLRMLAT